MFGPDLAMAELVGCTERKLHGPVRARGDRDLLRARLACPGRRPARWGGRARRRLGRREGSGTRACGRGAQPAPGRSLRGTQDARAVAELARIVFRGARRTRLRRLQGGWHIGVPTPVAEPGAKRETRSGSRLRASCRPDAPCKDGTVVRSCPYHSSAQENCRRQRGSISL